MKTEDVKCRRNYRIAIRVPGQPETYETVYVMRKVDRGLSRLMVEVVYEDGRRGLTFAEHLRAAA